MGNSFYVLQSRVKAGSEEEAVEKIQQKHKNYNLSTLKLALPGVYEYTVVQKGVKAKGGVASNELSGCN